MVSAFTSHSPPMEYLAFLDKLRNGFSHHLDGRIGIAPVLVEHIQFLHAEAAEGVLAYSTDIGGAAVLLCLHLHPVHILMPEFGGDAHFVGISFQRLAHQHLVGEGTVALGGIEQGNTSLYGFVYQTDASRFIGMLAAMVVQAHTAETHRRYGKGCLPAAQSPLFAHCRYAHRDVFGRYG